MLRAVNCRGLFQRLRCWLLVALVCASALAGCAHPAERAISGRWYGESVENFDPEHIPAATGWARGTSFEFEGTKVRITVPAEEPRTGTYRLSAIEDRTLTLAVQQDNGQLDQLKLIVDDDDSMRWVLGEGRTMVLRRK